MQKKLQKWQICQITKTFKIKTCQKCKIDQTFKIGKPAKNNQSFETIKNVKKKHTQSKTPKKIKSLKCQYG